MIDNYYLYFEITNINIIKKLFETLDKTTELVRLNLIKHKNNDIILEISCTNLLRTYFLKSSFNNELIKNFICNLDTIEFELIPNDLANILKSYDSSDNYILFYINNENKNIATIEFKCNIINELEELDNIKIKKTIKKTKQLVNKKLQKEKKFKLNINYPIFPEKKILKINYEKKISMNVNNFHKVCKDLSILFDYIKISSKNNKSLYFGYDSNRCDGLIKFKYDDNNVILEDLVNLKNNNINGVYGIEDIIIFSKLSDITTEFNFNIKNNYILESTYIIDKYGIINIMHIPLKEDMIKNTLTSYDNDYDNDNDNSDNISNMSNLTMQEEKKKKTINDKIIYIEIDKIVLFKSLCESIEKIVSEPIFKLESKNNKLIIKIVCINNSKNIMLDINIENIFDRYKHLDMPINLGISLEYLNDILKTVDKTDKLVLSIDKNDKQNLTIQIKNVDNNDSKRIYKIKLLNIEDIVFQSIKLENYTKKILIDPNEFYKICKDINSIGDEIKIIYDNKNLIFSSMNECKYANIIKKNSKIIDIQDNTNIDNTIDDNSIKENKIINEFEIKDIMILNKLSGFMENLNLYLKPDGKMVLESKFIESMGSVNIQYLTKNIIDIEPNDKNLIKSNIDSMDDKLLFFKLKKINFMKNIIDTIDKLVSDVEWVFTSNNKTKEKFVGLEITCTDSSKTLYVKCKLTDELFKSYYCDKEIFKFGMNLEYFNKILKLTDKNDIAIYCYIEKNDPNNLIIRFKNLEKKNKKIFKIPLQIINNKINKSQLSLNFEKKIILNCESFFSKCKIINNNSQFVEIECDCKQLIFKCVGDKEGIITLDDNDDNDLEIINLDNNNIKGIYEIKNILLFTKLSSITEEFSFYMKNNFALTYVFNFNEYGSLSVILSPVNEEHINNQLYDYSDDEDDIELINNNSNILDLY
jgi:hypothetical protein